MSTTLIRGREELRAALRGAVPVVLVPTMGALHDGHRALLRVARAAAGPAGTVVVSVFVNPLQFGPGEDFERYPRTLDDDLAICRAEHADLVFVPDVAQMYPSGQPAVTVDPGPAGQVLEGACRPGFFTGVLTIVLKLFGIVRPDIAVFGEKDAQQLALVRQMTTDFDLGVRITAVPTVRDPDGLAISSRNRYLSGVERTAALALPRALAAGAAAARDGAAAVLAAARLELDHADGVTVDYLSLADPVTFQSASEPGPAVLAAAARVGTTRLIDNVPLVLGGGRDAAHH